MQHHASTDFWTLYVSLPQQIRTRADKQFALMKENPQHPSLQFKKVGERRGQKFGRPELRLLAHCSWSHSVTTPSSKVIRRPYRFAPR